MVWWHWQQIDKEIDCKLLNHHMVNLILSLQETVFMVPQVNKFSTFSTSSTIRYTSELYNVYVKIVHVWVYSHFDVLLWGNLLIDMSQWWGWHTHTGADPPAKHPVHKKNLTCKTNQEVLFLLQNPLCNIFIRIRICSLLQNIKTFH